MSITWCDEAFSWRFVKKIERKYFTRTNYHMCRVKFFLSRRVPRPPELQKLMGGRWFKNLGIFIFSSFFTQFILYDDKLMLRWLCFFFQKSKHFLWTFAIVYWFQNVFCPFVKSISKEPAKILTQTTGTVKRSQFYWLFNAAMLFQLKVQTFTIL